VKKISTGKIHGGLLSLALAEKRNRSVASLAGARW
jgi:hypothetical protein